MVIKDQVENYQLQFFNAQYNQKQINDLTTDIIYKPSDQTFSIEKSHMNYQGKIIQNPLILTYNLSNHYLEGKIELNQDDINILAISTSEIKLSVSIDEEKTLYAVKKLHTIFELD